MRVCVGLPLPPLYLYICVCLSASFSILCGISSSHHLSLSQSLSLARSLSPFVVLSLYIYVCLPISFPIPPLLSVSVSLFLSVSLSLSFYFPLYLAQTTLHNSSLVTSPTALTPGITSTCQGQDLFKTSITFAGASIWNSLPQNIKSCISLPCFKRNLHRYMSENNLSSNLDGFV